jgi:hypothetical protein
LAAPPFCRPMPFDVARVRAETPGCAHVLHFNNAGAGLMPQPVLDAQVAYLAREAEVGAYEVGAEMHDALMDTYGAVAEMAWRPAGGDRPPGERHAGMAGRFLRYDLQGRRPDPGRTGPRPVGGEPGVPGALATSAIQVCSPDDDSRAGTDPLIGGAHSHRHQTPPDCRLNTGTRKPHPRLPGLRTPGGVPREHSVRARGLDAQAFRAESTLLSTSGQRSRSGCRKP